MVIAVSFIGIRWVYIGPGGWNAVIIALFVLEAYSVFSPVQLMDDESIFSVFQRMEGMGNTYSFILIAWIRCS